MIRVENNGKFYKITEDEYIPPSYDKLYTILSIIGRVFIDGTIVKCEDGEVLDWDSYDHLTEFFHDLNELTTREYDGYSYKFELLIGVDE